MIQSGAGFRPFTVSKTSVNTRPGEVTNTRAPSDLKILGKIGVEDHSLTWAPSEMDASGFAFDTKSWYKADKKKGSRGFLDFSYFLGLEHFGAEQAS